MTGEQPLEYVSARMALRMSSSPSSPSLLLALPPLLLLPTAPLPLIRLPSPLDCSAVDVSAKRQVRGGSNRSELQAKEHGQQGNREGRTRKRVEVRKVLCVAEYGDAPGRAAREDRRRAQERVRQGRVATGQVLAFRRACCSRRRKGEGGRVPCTGEETGKRKGGGRGARTHP
jgi:hypothetical protein